MQPCRCPVAHSKLQTALSMKILVLSDLHVEFAPFRPSLESAASADVVVLVGDIHQGTMAPSWARRTFPDKLIVLVAGRSTTAIGKGRSPPFDKLRTRMRCTCWRTPLSRSARCASWAPLWTDFEYFGEELRHAATLAAQRCMADYRLVEG